MIGDVVDDDVEPLCSPGEVLAGVVNDRVGADRPDEVGGVRNRPTLPMW
jgi:hypothetical protein